MESAPEKTVDVAIARGDGIGPELMDAVLAIFDAAKVALSYHEIEVGEAVYLRGQKSGIDPKSWETLRTCKAFLKAPITTPQGGGFRSLNVTIRAALGLYANVRPCVSYHPCIKTKHPGMDLVIVRENEEDLYAGIEYRPTAHTYQATKVMTAQGCEKIIRYAFNYALVNNRKKVTCFTKDNILKMSDGIFHKTFDEIAKEYPDITNEHWIIDIGAAKMADTPENFDVIVTPNLYGDILSDIAAQIAASVGLAGSANIGAQCAMFEAIHGSAPKRAGQNVANPSGLLLGAVMMLVHLGMPEKAAYIHNAWLKTIEDGIHTYDIYNETLSKEKVGTKEFAQSVIERLGEKPQTLQQVSYEQKRDTDIQHNVTMKPSTKTIVGVDLYIDNTRSLSELAEVAKTLDDRVDLQMITYRGVSIWPECQPETYVGEHLRLRFLGKHVFSHDDALDIQKKLSQKGFDITTSHMLYTFEGKPGFSVAQTAQ